MSEENPFNNLQMTTRQEQSLVNVEQSRAVAEVQSALIIAKRFPRDQREAMDRILQACTMPELAQKALFTVKKDKKETDMPGIRLAEVIAQGWGNIDYGLNELSQADGMSIIQAFAWDLETNTKQTKTFQVPHIRYSKTYGNKKLTTPDDVYSAVANYGMRRVRACILGIIPPDVIVAAQKQIELTLRTEFEVTPALIQSLLDKFAEFDITKAMVEARINRRIDTLTPGLMAQLGKIYNSLRDGMSQPSDWFDVMADMDVEGSSSDPDLFYKTFTDVINSESSTFTVLDAFVSEVAKKHKLQPIEVKDGAMKDPAKFAAAFKKFLAKQPKPEKAAAAEEPKKLAPINCRKSDPAHGVFPDECQACGVAADCDELKTWEFDQTQNK